jgi:hypothetical protein
MLTYFFPTVTKIMRKRLNVKRLSSMSVLFSSVLLLRRNFGLLVIEFLLFMRFFTEVIDVNFSIVFLCSFIMYSMFVVISTVAWAQPVSRLCWVHLEVLSFSFTELNFSLNLVENILLFCPTCF